MNDHVTVSPFSVKDCALIAIATGKRVLNQMGEKARAFVRENFLITRHLREYLTLFFVLLYGDQKRIEL
jgi:hypothetical protein